MQFNDLLSSSHIDPASVIVFRHCPKDLPDLRRDFLRLVDNDHGLFNGYQQTQSLVVENAMLGARYVASFIGHEPGKALFVGLYEIRDSWPLSYKQFWKEPLNKELRERYGMVGMEDEKGTTRWFDLVLRPFRDDLRKKLVVRWPGRERSWWRWANRNKLLILSKGVVVDSGGSKPSAASARGASGAGFGDPAENPIVEAAGISAVTTEYENDGWTVNSVEREKCGFDLDCRKGCAIANVEVKGVSGSKPSFPITWGEVQQAKTNPNFVLAVVTSALTKSRRVIRYSGPEFLRSFNLRPVQYQATLR